MLIKKLSIENYKSFYSSQDIQFESGFNLLIGKNNSGKTTALELITQLSPINNAHRSQLSMQNYDDKPIENSRYSITIETTVKELYKTTNNNLVVPLPINPIQLNESQIGQKIESGKLILECFYHSDTFLEVESCFGKSPRYNSHQPGNGIKFSYNDGALNCITNSYSTVARPLISNLPSLKNSFYRFSAVRNPKTRHGMDLTTDLSPDASNLAFCINYLQTNDASGHLLFCQLISRIFPEISWIQSTPDLQTNNFELRCLPLLPEKRRNDLAIPLDKMGTGIGNILAILYVVLTARFSKVIAIDEPNLFLHPKALRELLQILSTEGKHHQYILTGHSPDILTAIEPSTITYFDIKNLESVTRSIKNNEFHTIRSELSDLGIRMTELHARDRVLWVEGQTEEIVFPKLLNAFFPEYAAGTAVLRVTHTGTFEKKKGIPADEVADAYQRLTNQSLVPPLVAILLDKESRTMQEIDKLLSKSKTLKILPVKMIENYVIDIDAINYVLTKHGSENTKEEIEAKISGKFDQSISDGAALLNTIFSDSKPITIEYRKTTHTAELFDWIIDNKPELLNDFRDFIANIFKEAQS